VEIELGKSAVYLPAIDWIIARKRRRFGSIDAGKRERLRTEAGFIAFLAAGQREWFAGENL
jgi:hypothetical protein